MHFHSDASHSLASLLLNSKTTPFPGHIWRRRHRREVDVLCFISFRQNENIMNGRPRFGKDSDLNQIHLQAEHSQRHHTVRHCGKVRHCCDKLLCAVDTVCSCLIPSVCSVSLCLLLSLALRSFSVIEGKGRMLQHL